MNACASKPLQIPVLKTINMKIRTPNPLRLISIGLCLLCSLLAYNVRAVTVFWDPNGASAPTSGTWTTTANQWATSSVLTASPGVWNSAAAAVFCAGTANPGAITVTVNSPISFAGFFNGGTGVPWPGCTTLTLNGTGSLSMNANPQACSTGSTNSTFITIPITGPGIPVAESGGKLYFYATNSYTGGTLLGWGSAGLGWNGILNFTNGFAFGTGTIYVSVSGGALVLNETSYPVTITNAVAATNTGSLNIVGNPSGLTFSGPWTLGSGTPVIGSGNAAGNVITISGVISGTGGFTKDHTGLMIFSATNTYSGVTTISAGTLQIGDGATRNGAVAGTITDNASLVFNNPNAATYSKVISGTGTVTNQGAGILTLSGASTYAGTTAINAGSTTKLGVANALPTGAGKGDLFLSGKLEMGNFSCGTGGLNGAGTVDNSTGTATYTLTVGNNGNGGTFSGIIQNTTALVALTKAGAGTQILDGTSTYSGATIINAGTLEYTAASAIAPASSVLVQSAGTLDLQNLTPLTVAALGGAGAFNNLAGTLNVNGNSATVTTQNFEGFSCIAGPLNGTATLVKSGTHAMAFRPTAAGSSPFSSFGGSLTFSAGTLSVGGGPNMLPTTYPLTVPSSGTFQLDANSQTVASLNGSGNINLGGGALTVAGAGTYSGVIRNSDIPGSSTALGNGLRGYYFTNIDFTGLNTVRDDSPVNFPDMTFVPGYSPTAKTNQVSVRWLGQVLSIDSGAYYFGTKCDDGSRLWVNGQLVVDNWITQGATLKMGPASGIFLSANTRYDVVLEYFNNTAGGAAGLYWAPPNSAGPGNDPTNAIPSNYLFLPGPGALVMSGPGTLQLTAANTYTGGSTVSGGTLEATVAGALGSGNVSVAAGATLTLDSSAAINSAADLLVDASATAVNLIYGGTDNIHALSLDGGFTFQPAGTYGSLASGATHKLPIFTGNGILNVGATGTTTTLHASNTSPVYGTPITLTSTVTGTGTPTGTVAFYDNGNWLGTNALASGAATLSVSNLQVGVSHFLTAVYSGDATHAASTSAAVSVNTSAAPLTPTVNIVTKIYDGTTTAVIGSLSGPLPSDTNFVYAAAGYTANFATKDAGTQSVTVTGLALAGSLAGNYTLTAPSSVTGTITPKALKVFNTTASNKPYDGTTTATINTATAALGVPEAVGTGTTADGTNYIGDTVTLVTTGAVGNFSDPNVGTNKTVTITGLTLGGAQAGDYSITPPTATNNISTPCSSANALANITQGVGNSFTLSFVGTPQALFYVLSGTNASQALSTWKAVPGSTNRAAVGTGLWSATVTNPAPAFYRAKAITACP